jgi:hypothetical protein
MPAFLDWNAIIIKLKPRSFRIEVLNFSNMPVKIRLCHKLAKLAVNQVIPLSRVLLWFGLTALL